MKDTKSKDLGPEEIVLRAMSRGTYLQYDINLIKPFGESWVILYSIATNTRSCGAFEEIILGEVQEVISPFRYGLSLYYLYLFFSSGELLAEESGLEFLKNPKISQQYLLVLGKWTLGEVARVPKVIDRVNRGFCFCVDKVMENRKPITPN